MVGSGKAMVCTRTRYRHKIIRSPIELATTTRLLSWCLSSSFILNKLLVSCATRQVPASMDPWTLPLVVFISLLSVVHTTPSSGKLLNIFRNKCFVCRTLKCNYTLLITYCGRAHFLWLFLGPLVPFTTQKLSPFRPLVDWTVSKRKSCTAC